MEAETNLHTFHEFPENAPLPLADQPLLWAGADGGPRYRLRAGIRFVLGKPDAGAGTATTDAGDAVDFRNIGVRRGRGESLRRVLHHERRTCRGEDVLFLTGIALGERCGMRWMRDDCDGRRNGDRDRESAGKD
jgi:hypothetical protein